MSFRLYDCRHVVGSELQELESEIHPVLRAMWQRRYGTRSERNISQNVGTNILIEVTEPQVMSRVAVGMVSVGDHGK